MKRAAIVIVALVLGVVALGYPAISNYLAERNGSQAVQAYDETVDRLSPDEVDALWAAAEEYNQSLTGQPVHDPFIAGSGMAMAENYRQVLNVGGVMGYVEIPKIGVSLPIYHGTSEAVLRKGAGHLEGSTLPIGGESRHAVLTGHTGLTHAKLFTDLVELAEGDLVYIHVLGKVLAYEVDQLKVIEPQNTEDLKRVDGKDLVTLLTCTPYGVNSHRLLVRGVRVDYDPQARASIEPVAGSAVDLLALRAGAITGGVMLALTLVVVLVRRRGSRGTPRGAR